MSKTETQSEALQLAEKIERHGSILSWEVARLRNEIAAELRRLDAENKALRARIDPLGQVIAELRALTPEQLRAEMAKHKESDIAVALRELSASQEPLGDEFSKVLYENLDALQAAAKTGNAA